MVFSSFRSPDWSACLRRACLAWMAGALAVYQTLDTRQKTLQVPFGAGIWRLLLLGAVFVGVLLALRLLSRGRDTARAERWSIFVLFLLLAGESVLWNQDPWYLLVLAAEAELLQLYAIHGRNQNPAPAEGPENGRKLWALLTAALSLPVFGLLALWGWARVRGFSAATFDFGIFAQMFHKLRATGLPLTTLERDGLLSHFAVHLSPIWYLLLPFWMLWPEPALLPILQAAVLVSSVIPLWLLAKQLGLPPLLRFLACAVLLVHPVLSGGTAYDIHENCFLTPLLLWLFWAAERRRAGLTALFAVLTCAVKEDAPVYVAILGLYLLARGLLDREAQARRFGLWLLGGAMLWFLGAVLLLRRFGSGIMDYRYSGLMDPERPSLLSMVWNLLAAPLLAVSAAAAPEKLLYAVRALLPLLFPPLLTRKQERYLLLLPFLLMHLLPNYPYQYDILFQYGYGTLAFLLYLSLLNLRDLPRCRFPVRAGVLICAALAGVLVLRAAVLPNAKTFLLRYTDHRESWDRVRAELDEVPKDASVTAATYYTQALSDRPVVYDLLYTTPEHLLETDYVVLQPMYDSVYAHWDSTPGAGDGRDLLYGLLEENGYSRILSDTVWLEIYRRGPG